MWKALYMFKNLMHKLPSYTLSVVVVVVYVLVKVIFLISVPNLMFQFINAKFYVNYLVQKKCDLKHSKDKIKF